MRFAMNILTPLAAFCLLGTAYECPAQEKHFDRAIDEKATEGSPIRSKKSPDETQLPSRIGGGI